MQNTEKAEKKADIIAVAKLAGVSASTVSRFFNHPDIVRNMTRRKIEEAVKATGYIRNRAAQTIHGIRSGTIGMIVPTIDHAIFAELVQSFSDAVDESGFTILLASHGYDLNKEYSLVRKMLEHRVDGLALVGLKHASETEHLIDRQAIPAVLLWNHAPDAPLPCVGADNFEAGRLVGQHIAALGHRQIASVFPPLVDNDRAGQRYAGLTSALADQGLSIPDKWMLETPYSVADAKLAIRSLLNTKQRPSAIICGNDVLAWGALHAASSLGISVPSHLSVTGIGDFKGSKDFEPGLTTVRIPARQIGERAGRLIAEAIVTADIPTKSHLIAPEFIARGTTMAAGVNSMPSAPSVC